MCRLHHSLLNLLFSLLLAIQPVQASTAVPQEHYGIGNLGAGASFQWEGSLGHVILHGIAGCAFAEASGGDCAAGAAGGIAQSLYAGYLGRNGLTGSEYIQTASLIGGTVGFFFSGGEGANVGLGSTVAASGLKNNYLSHDDLVNLRAELAACGDSVEGDCDRDIITAKYRRISHQNDIDLVNQCGEDWTCINDRLSTMATDAEWDSIKGDHWDVYSEIDDVIKPGQVVNDHLARVQEGGVTYETREALYCGGVSSPECDAVLLQMDQETAPYLLGGLGVVIGGLAVTPYLAELCLATPSCVAALGAAEISGTISDLTACAAGDGIACTAAAIPVITTGGLGGKIDDLLGVPNRGLNTAEKAGILREASNLPSGNRTLAGSATRVEATELGQAWVGPGYRVASDGKTLVSADGLRQYRPPQPKRNSPYTHTGTQANFEQRHDPVGRWTSNAHLDISD